MSMWSDYFYEVRGLETLETDYGLAVYEVYDDCIFVHHAFTKSKVRSTGFGKEIMFELGNVAKKHGKEMLRFAVDLDNHNAEKILSIYLHVGGKLWSVEHPRIYIYLLLEDIEKNSRNEDLKWD